jgi:hypothetical protein
VDCEGVMARNVIASALPSPQLRRSSRRPNSPGDITGPPALITLSREEIVRLNNIPLLDSL